MDLIHFDQLAIRPWKNGGGVTRELASYPAHAGPEGFFWRASIADVNESGPFSVFPGVDRIIVLLDGDGMHLEFADGKVHALTTPFCPYRFRGDDALHSRLAESPSKDFNLMLRRDAFDGNIEVWSEERIITPAPCFMLLFCARGRWELIDSDGLRQELRALQTLAGECAEERIAIRPLEPGSILLGVSIVHAI